MNHYIRIVVSLVALIALASCSSNGRVHTSVSYGVGYGGYYGASPWRNRPVYVVDDRPIIIDDGPVATPMPDFGMPDAGGMDFPDFDF